MGTELTSDIGSDYRRNSFVPHLLSVAGTRERAGFTACFGGSSDDCRKTAPLSSELRHCTACPARVTDAVGSHLGSTLKPGGAVLTRGVFRRSGSVACIRADASPNEVLACSIVHDGQAAVNSALSGRVGGT
ncbi:hypothetical protein MTER_36420 [Mycolicibacter terrae]|uniref:Uncharacterized protein n=1 Tax=Mycolicibacter terrae TaxID=1788 RepID=A0AAD1I0Z2_9MYCO|nr:hypothetical protein MTER_36420 [Mycolicibacter terrae]